MAFKHRLKPVAEQTGWSATSSRFSRPRLPYSRGDDGQVLAVAPESTSDWLHA